MKNILNTDDFSIVEPINKGWADDKKYYVETRDKRKMLLRIADVSEHEGMKARYSMLELLDTLNIIMPRPVELGLCEEGKSAYQLLTWVEGADAESLLPEATTEEQTEYGIKSGKQLRRIHSVHAPGDAEHWGARFDRMLQYEIAAYRSHTDVHCDYGSAALEYLIHNADIPNIRNQVLIHGDYNPGNIIITPNGDVGTIDFALSYADPYWDIFKCGWRPDLHSSFYSAQIQGYFDNEPTREFWSAYSYYFAYGVLLALRAPREVGFTSREEGKGVSAYIAEWFRNFTSPVPSWYSR